MNNVTQSTCSYVNKMLSITFLYLFNQGQAASKNGMHTIIHYTIPVLYTCVLWPV